MTSSDSATLKVCHLVHSTKVGGVEVAAAALQLHQPDGIQYQVGVLSGTARTGLGGSFTQDDAPGVAINRPDFRALGINNPLSIIPTAIWILRSRPDVLIASLWRSVLVGVLLKILLPRRTFVVFVHNTQFKNFLDRISHRIGFHFADAIFCDAEATLMAMRAEPQLEARPIHIVPLLARPDVHVPERLKMMADASRAQRMADGGPIRFIYWGRMAGQKRLDRSLHLLAALVGKGVEAHLDLVGPDEGQMKKIWDLADALNLEGHIRWQGPADWDHIRNVACEADFFLQLSDFEGLGMSVIEAMQLGLVPVVTPVGQIADFTTDNFSAIHYFESAETATSLLACWQNPAAYSRLSTAAMAEWVGKESLQQTFASACRSASTAAQRDLRYKEHVRTSR